MLDEPLADPVRPAEPPARGRVVVAATFAPDGSHLYAVPDRGRGMRWDISPENWKRHACRVAGRELTPREWHDALRGRGYQTVCQTD